jgi:DNA-binding GntR family transcriptional regulator
MYWYTRTMARATVPAVPAAPALPPLPRSTTTSDLVVDSIRRAILDGYLDPGTTLVERRLAEQLGVSKTPVREALITLAASGLVTITPNRGAIVRAVSGDDVRHAYETRLLLEPWAVSQTVRRRAADTVAASPVPTDRVAADPAAKPAGAEAVVADAVVAEAEAALDEARRHLADANHVLLSLANRRFHRALYKPCGNPIVVGHLDALQELAALGAVVLWERLPTWEIEHAEHELILAAVASGAADRAERLMRRHIRQWVQRLAR